ncbi:MAG: GHKL domain-containing protein [Deltaproteobacteria bacterium]|nr:GHKL domain-containing protein [Deltaproteobacteria bacterium]
MITEKIKPRKDQSARPFEQALTRAPGFTLDRVDTLNKKSGFKETVHESSGYEKNNDELSQTLRIKSIGLLAAGIAHEINTPIQFIGDNIQFLKDSFTEILNLLNSAIACVKMPVTDSKRESAVAEIDNIINSIDTDYLIEEIPKAIEQSINGLQRVSEIAQAMKQFSHPGSDEMQASNLNNVIKNVVTVTKNEWKYVAEVKTDLDSSLPPVPCKVGQINQVILNLIINAVHAIKDAIGQEGTGKGTITITTSHDDSWAVIHVSDTGTGIPEEIKPRIFDTFFTTKEAGKGTGLGLAISHSIIVKNHKGSIHIESEPGKGSVMIICLPLRGDYE